MATRDIYLKIERIDGYSPVAPQDKVAPPMEYKRDCMRNPGHEDATIPDSEVKARAVDAVVYREYEDPGYLIPKVDKLIESDINEPIYSHRVPGTVIYAHPGDRLRVHVLNCDTMPHSFHTHGLAYGIDSDGAWPFGTENDAGQRSDEICPGQCWTYAFDVLNESLGVWPFHDHAQMPAAAINRGLFGGFVILPRGTPLPGKIELPAEFVDFKKELLRPFKGIGPRMVRLDENRRTLLRDHLEFIGEYLERELIVPRRPPRTIHAPVFFHVMVDAAAKPVFDSGDLEELVGVYERVFDVQGSFDYFCQFHPMMEGTVNVTPGAPNLVTVNIIDGPPMAFSPAAVDVNVGGTVRWENHSIQHHTVTSKDGASTQTHCINGRGFVGNSPTIVAEAGQKINWYVFNLDIGHEFHNFHPHAQRWKFAGENIDVRSLSPAESFAVETRAPDVILMTPAIKKIQSPKYRPKNARKYRLKGDYVFHCHVHHHMMNGMIGLVRSKQTVWLTPKMAAEIEARTGLPIDDGSNACPVVDLKRCKKHGDGEWKEVAGGPEVTFMHSMPLPNTKKVLYWGYTRADQSRLWDYSTPAGAYSSPANQPASLPGHDPSSSDLWSSEHTFLDTPQGTLLANGGFTPNKAFLFDPPTETWVETGATAHNRFYSTTLTLADGRAITLFGSASKSIEAYDPGTGTWAAPVAMPAAFNHHVYYPWTYLLPDGRLFIAGPHVPTHRFSWDAPVPFEAFNTIHGNRSTGGEKGTSVLLTLRPPNYEPKVLIAAGNTAATESTAEIIDLSAVAPGWAALPILNQARNHQCTATLLPDGRVFLAGGIIGGADGGPCETYDPQDPLAGWKLGPTMKYPRGYHSSFVLLSDGSVLGGGDPPSGGSPTPHERFFPGYFTQPRPSITNAPATINYASAFVIDSPEALAISEVVLLRPGAVTHGFNMSQRAVELVVTGAVAGTLNVEAPPNGNIAPPGYYLLFILDGNRVPSEGRWVRMTP